MNPSQKRKHQARVAVDTVRENGKSTKKSKGTLQRKKKAAKKRAGRRR